MSEEVFVAVRDYPVVSVRVPPALYRRLQADAGAAGRSTAKQAATLLLSALQGSQRSASMELEASVATATHGIREAADKLNAVGQKLSDSLYGVRDANAAVPRDLADRTQPEE